MKLFRYGFAALILFTALGLPSMVRADNTPPVVTPGPGTGPAFTLRYKFPVGTTVNYNMTMSSTSAMNINAKSMPFNMVMNMSEAMNFQSVNPDGTGVINSTINSMTATMNGQPLPVTAAQQYMGKPIPMTMSPTGGIISMSGPTTNPMISQIFGAGGLNRFGAALPTQPIKVGDSWVETVPIAALHTAMECTQTLKSIQIVNGDQVAEIDGVFSSTNTPSAPSTAPTPVKVTSMTGDSVSMFDIDKGIMESSNFGMSVSMNLSMPSQNGSTSTPMVSTTKMTMALANPGN